MLGPSPSASLLQECRAGEGTRGLLCHGMPTSGAAEGQPSPSSVSRQLVTPSLMFCAWGTGGRVVLAWRRDSSRAPGMLPCGKGEAVSARQSCRELGNRDGGALGQANPHHQPRQPEHTPSPAGFSSPLCFVPSQPGRAGHSSAAVTRTHTEAGDKGRDPQGQPSKACSDPPGTQHTQSVPGRLKVTQMDSPVSHSPLPHDTAGKQRHTPKQSWGGSKGRGLGAGRGQGWPQSCSSLLGASVSISFPHRAASVAKEPAGFGPSTFKP